MAKNVVIEIQSITTFLILFQFFISLLFIVAKERLPLFNNGSVVKFFSLI